MTAKVWQKMASLDLKGYELEKLKGWGGVGTFEKSTVRNEWLFQLSYLLLHFYHYSVLWELKCTFILILKQNIFSQHALNINIHKL